MINDETVLSNLLQAAQMGQSGITAVMPMACGVGLRQALKAQRKEYANLEQDIKSLARKLDCPVRQSPPMVRYMSSMGARGQLLFGDRDSKIAGMMIQGNTRGAIQSQKDLHNGKLNNEVSAMARKMLETEKRNIQQMEPYL